MCNVVSFCVSVCRRAGFMNDVMFCSTYKRRFICFRFSVTIMDRYGDLLLTFLERIDLFDCILLAGISCQ